MTFEHKIEELYTLQSNWDGYGAREVSALSIKNLILLKKELGDWNFDLWQIAPGVNGDIFVNYKGHIHAGIVINENTYSWYMEPSFSMDDFKIEGEMDQLFDAKNVSYKMNDIEFVGMTIK